MDVFDIELIELLSQLNDMLIRFSIVSQNYSQTDMIP